MLRIILVHLLLFLLPTLGYAFWLFATRRSAGQEQWEDAPRMWLAITGAGLVVISLLFFATFEGTPPDGVYKPAEFKDGKLVPGRFE